MGDRFASGLLDAVDCLRILGSCAWHSGLLASEGQCQTGPCPGCRAHQPIRSCSTRAIVSADYFDDVGRHVLDCENGAEAVLSRALADTSPGGRVAADAASNS